MGSAMERDWVDGDGLGLGLGDGLGDGEGLGEGLGLGDGLGSGCGRRRLRRGLDRRGRLRRWFRRWLRRGLDRRGRFWRWQLGWHGEGRDHKTGAVEAGCLQLGHDAQEGLRQHGRVLAALDDRRGRCRIAGRDGRVELVGHGVQGLVDGLECRLRGRIGVRRQVRQRLIGGHQGCVQLRLDGLR